MNLNHAHQLKEIKSVIVMADKDKKTEGIHLACSKHRIKACHLNETTTTKMNYLKMGT